MCGSTRPITTLFLLQSVDGKISTGATDALDFDRDLPDIPGVGEGLGQYYAIEQTTDLVSFSSGRVQAKVGVNTRPLDTVKRGEVSFVIVDNLPHLNEHGVEYFARRSERLYVITTNRDHPASTLASLHSNIVVLDYEGLVDFNHAFARLGSEYGVERMTIQTGGTLNAVLFRADLIDFVSILVAPCVIGGSSTPTSVDGASLRGLSELGLVRPLRLTSCRPLRDSYVHLEYEVSRTGVSPKVTCMDPAPRPG